MAILPGSAVPGRLSIRRTARVSLQADTARMIRSFMMCNNVLSKGATPLAHHILCVADAICFAAFEGSLAVLLRMRGWMTAPASALLRLCGLLLSLR